VKLLIQQNEIGGKRKTAAATKQLEQAQERISEVSRIIKRLYEDNVNGKISDERFMASLISFFTSSMVVPCCLAI
jgi:hypothetical protein